MADTTKGKIKVILITLMIVLADVLCIIGVVSIWCHSLIFPIKLFSSALLVFFLSFWTWAGWKLWKTSNPFKDY